MTSGKVLIPMELADQGEQITELGACLAELKLEVQAVEEQLTDLKK